MNNPSNTTTNNNTTNTSTPSTAPTNTALPNPWGGPAANANNNNNMGGMGQGALNPFAAMGGAGGFNPYAGMGGLGGMGGEFYIVEPLKVRTQCTFFCLNIIFLYCH